VLSRAQHSLFGGAYSKHSKSELATELKNAPRQGTRDLPKSGGTGVIHGRVVPIGPVEGIERIRLELKVHAFSEWQIKYFPQR
jgi:hypothetical protein